MLFGPFNKDFFFCTVLAIELGVCSIFTDYIALLLWCMNFFTSGDEEITDSVPESTKLKEN